VIGGRDSGLDSVEVSRTFVGMTMTGFMLERELNAKSDTRLSQGPYVTIDSAGGDVNMLPAIVVAVGAFLGMFVGRPRSGRAPSRESRAPRP
jgi:hypothetical protein